MSMNTSLSRSQPFANPYTMANNNDNSAERNVSTPFHNVGVEDNVEGLACDYSFAETREVRKLQLLDEYKVTVLKKIKLFLKHTLRAARKGAMAGGITGLTSGAVAAMFTMHISAIPAFTGAGVALGGGIGAGIGAIKGARAVHNLTSVGLLEDKVADANAAAKKTRAKFTKAMNRADALFIKMRYQLKTGQYLCQPSEVNAMEVIEKQLKEDIEVLRALTDPDKGNKADLKALTKVQEQLATANKLKTKLAAEEQTRNSLQTDLEILTEQVDLEDSTTSLKQSA